MLPKISKTSQKTSKNRLEDVSGASWNVLGAFGSVLRASWKRLGASWERLDTIFFGEMGRAVSPRTPLRLRLRLGRHGQEGLTRLRPGGGRIETAERVPPHRRADQRGGPI